MTIFKQSLSALAALSISSQLVGESAMAHADVSPVAHFDNSETVNRGGQIVSAFIDLGLDGDYYVAHLHVDVQNKDMISAYAGLADATLNGDGRIVSRLHAETTSAPGRGISGDTRRGGDSTIRLAAYETVTVSDGDHTIEAKRLITVRNVTFSFAAQSR